MTARDYRGALLRGWRLLMLLALMGAVVGLLRPVHTAKAVVPAYLASVTVEANPGGGLSLQTLTFYASDRSVIAQAAQAANLNEPPAALMNVMSIARAKVGYGLHALKIPALQIGFTQLTAKGAIDLANAFTTTLQNDIYAKAQDAYNAHVTAVGNNVSNLQDQLSTIDDDITTVNSGGSVDTTNLFQTLQQDAAANSSTDGSGSGSGSTNASTSDGSASVSNAAFTSGPAPGAVLTAGKSGGSTATTTPPISTKASPDSQMAALEIARQVVQSRLNAQLKIQADLATSGPSQPTFTVLQKADVALPLVGKTAVSISNNRFANVLGGGIVGMLLGGGILVAVESLDRNVRSVRQAEEAFELPVVGEIPVSASLPKPAPGDPAPPPRLEVALDPAGAVAEAYRRLRTAVLLEPLAADRLLLAGANGYGYSYANGNGNGNGKSGRRVILVASAGSEVTRSAVIANLAAAYAETGDRALVVSLGHLGWQAGTDVRAADPRAGFEFGPADIVPRSSPTMVAGVRRLSFDMVLESRGQVPAYGPSVLAAAREVADVVLVDGPGLLHSHDALVLLPAVDVVLVVAEAGTTNAPQAKEVSQMLRRVAAPVLGVVFTNGRPNGKASAPQLTGLDDHIEAALAGYEPLPTAEIPV